jgi:hypothetical protein
MKKIPLFLIIVTTSVKAQTLFLEENFDYQTGTLSMITSSWVESPSGSTDINVAIGNLSYSNYQSSGIGKLILLNGGATGRSGVYRKFTPQSTTGTTVYWSFLLEVTSTVDMDTHTSNGDYFANFQNDAVSSLKNYLYIRQGNTVNTFNIGLAKSSATSLTWYPDDLLINTTYLIVLAYSFIAGNSNDVSKLWINPSLIGTEPTADISITSGADASDIALIQFRQNEKSGDMNIDGIRVSDSWSQAPLPVQLTSLTAGLYENKIKLNWSTATEVNNYGFDILRQVIPQQVILRQVILRQAQDDNGWEKIGFVQGHGNSNSPKDYTFVDANPPAGKVLYKLKQIDFDGAFEYSKAVEVNVETPQEFRLAQNYPNPFNPSTVISYQLPMDGNVTLKVYDMLGNEIATLVNQFQRAGSYNYTFSIIHYTLSSGVYYYRLQSGNFVQTKKFILMK